MDEVLRHRTPTENMDSTGLSTDNTLQACRGKPSDVKVKNGITCSFPAWSYGSDHACRSQSPELSCELSSPAAFQFFLLFLEFKPESESLREPCFRFLRLRVLPLSSSSLLSPEPLSSSRLLLLDFFLFLCRLLFLFLRCLSFVVLLSLLLLTYPTLLCFSTSSFFFFFFFLWRKDFFGCFKRAAVSDFDFFVFPISSVVFSLSLLKKKTKMVGCSVDHNAIKDHNAKFTPGLWSVLVDS